MVVPSCNPSRKKHWLCRSRLFAKEGVLFCVRHVALAACFERAVLRTCARASESAGQGLLECGRSPVLAVAQVVVVLDATHVPTATMAATTSYDFYAHCCCCCCKHDCGNTTGITTPLLLLMQLLRPHSLLTPPPPPF